MVDKSSKKLDNFSGLKVMALLVIFIQHNGLFLNNLDQRACDILFIVSGYLIQFQYNNSEISSRYGLRKLLTAYPLHIVCFGFSLIYLILSRGFSYPKDIILALLNLSLLQSWFTWENCMYSYNAVSWFLSSLLAIYVLAPKTVRLIKKVKPNACSFLLALVLVIRLGIELANNLLYNIYVFCNPVFSILSAIAGMLICRVNMSNNHAVVLKRNFIVVGLFSFAEITSILLIVISTYRFYSQWNTTYYIGLCCVFIYFFSYNYGVISRFCSFSFWKAFSNIQFEFFMIHYIVIQFLAVYLRGILLFIVSFVVTYIFAYGYHYIISGVLNRGLNKLAERVEKTFFIDEIKM